jgi:hypothetical protein
MPISQSHSHAGCINRMVDHAGVGLLCLLLLLCSIQNIYIYIYIYIYMRRVSAVCGCVSMPYCILKTYLVLRMYIPPQTSKCTKITHHKNTTQNQNHAPLRALSHFGAPASASAWVKLEPSKMEGRVNLTKIQPNPKSRGRSGSRDS